MILCVSIVYQFVKRTRTLETHKITDGRHLLEVEALFHAV